jgi:hypothetical protein
MANPIDYNTGFSNTSTFFRSIVVFQDGEIHWISQTFQASQSYDISSVKLRLSDFYSDAEGIGTITVSIRAVSAGKPTGADLASGTYDGDTLGASQTTIEFTFGTPYSLSSGTSYAIVVRRAISGRLTYGASGGNRYANGARVESHDSGASWFTPSATVDLWFETHTPLPSKPINPDPAHQETDVDFSDRTISWDNGGGATSYDVYIGDASDNLTKVSAGQAGLTYTVTDANMELFPKGVCYWRIDAINAGGTTTGDDWYFTVITKSFIRYGNNGSISAIRAIQLDRHKIRVVGGDGIIYGVPIVATSDDDASPVRVFDGSSVKAFVNQGI